MSRVTCAKFSPIFLIMSCIHLHTHPKQQRSTSLLHGRDCVILFMGPADTSPNIAFMFVAIKLHFWLIIYFQTPLFQNSWGFSRWLLAYCKQVVFYGCSGIKMASIWPIFVQAALYCTARNSHNTLFQVSLYLRRSCLRLFCFVLFLFVCLLLLFCLI